jgi:hypothetical protein
VNGVSDGVGQLTVGSVLEHQRRRAGVDRPPGECRVLLHREHDDLQGRNLLAQGTDCVETRPVVHPEIEYEHLRTVALYVTHDDRKVFRLGDHL